MEKVVRVFNSFEEADASDIEQDMRSTPRQRIAAVLELQTRMYADAAEQRFARVYRIAQLERS